MTRWSLLIACLLLGFLASTALCDTESSSDEDVEVAVEGEDEEQESTKSERPRPSGDEEKKEKEYAKPPPEIEWEILEESAKCRTRVTNDDIVGFHFVGKLEDGTVFYDSEEDNEKDEWVSFPMGLGESIKGLELGLLGMCQDEVRKVVVEPAMIKNGRRIFDPKDGKVPRDQKLIFEVRMMAMSPNYNKGMPNMFKVYDTDKDEKLTQEEIAAYMIEEGTFPEGELVNKLAKEVIDKDDRNKDGVIQWVEFSGPKHDEL